MAETKTQATLKLIERAKNGETLDQLLKELEKPRTLKEILLPKMGDYSNEVLASYAECSRAYIYGMFDGTKHPEKDVLLRIAFVLGLSVEETQEMLKVAHRGVLTSKSERDVCIISGLVNGLTLEEMDQVLEQKNQALLTPAERYNKSISEQIHLHLVNYNQREHKLWEKKKAKDKNVADFQEMDMQQLLYSAQCSPEIFKDIVNKVAIAPRDFLLRVSLILKLNLAETNALLRAEENSILSVKDTRDMYIMNGIANKAGLNEVDAALRSHGLKPLLDEN